MRQTELPLRPEGFPRARSFLFADPWHGWKNDHQVIPQGPAIERAKAQIAEYRRFRHLARELIAVSEQICSAQLRDAQSVFTTKAKKNFFADLLAMDIVQETETLLGRQAMENLDFEALEIAVRQQVLQLAGRAVEQRLKCRNLG